MSRAAVTVLIVVLGLTGPGVGAAERPAGEGRVHLVDIAEQAGLTAPTICGKEGNPSILDGTGPGLTLLDYDGDGLLDIYFVNGSTLQDVKKGVSHDNALYRAVGDGTYTDVTANAGLEGRGWAMGAAGLLAVGQIATGDFVFWPWLVGALAFAPFVNREWRREWLSRRIYR